MNKASVCIIENDKGEVLMLDRVHEPLGYGFVGGRLDEGETVLEAVIREVWEESRIQIEDPEFLGTVVSARENFLVSVFTTKFDYTPKVTLSDEHKDFVWTKNFNLHMAGKSDEMISLYNKRTNG